jgi:nucleotide-binding universal stress UspA family protein
MFAPKTILVGTDFSEFSDRALKDAMEIAEKYKAKLILLHVVDENIQQCVADYCLAEEVFAEVKMKSERSSMEKMKEEVGDIAPRRNGIQYKVRTGVPYSEILKEQQEDKADLIILGSHGKRGFVHNLIGNVADKVTRGAAVPVLVVR